MDPAAHAYTAQDWVLIIGAVFTGLTSLAAAVLGLINNFKSRSNGVKLDATVAQTREIARAVPDASTAPTDAVVNKGA